MFLPLLLLLHPTQSLPNSPFPPFTYFGPNFGPSPAPSSRHSLPSPTYSTFSVAPYNQEPWLPVQPALSFLPQQTGSRREDHGSRREDQGGDQYPSFTQGPVNSAIPWTSYTTLPTSSARPEETTTRSPQPAVTVTPKSGSSRP